MHENIFSTSSKQDVKVRCILFVQVRTKGSSYSSRQEAFERRFGWQYAKEQESFWMRTREFCRVVQYLPLRMHVPLAS